MPSSSILRSRLLIVPAILAVALAGCSTNRPCAGNSDYLQSRERPPLQMPEGVSGSERVGGTALKIPAAAPDPDKLEPEPRCLDEPPPFFKLKPAVADTAEAAVNVWASAWANRKADQVAAFYSPGFQAQGDAGAAAFVAERKDQVMNGPRPEPRLENVTVTDPAPDRKVVSFVQTFGNDKVRRELTLVREPTGWRIVAERTFESL
jgi:hypothetical protein